jgi:hypothetical protein
VRSRDENKDLGFIAVDALIARIKAEGVPPSQRNG